MRGCLCVSGRKTGWEHLSGCSLAEGWEEERVKTSGCVITARLCGGRLYLATRGVQDTSTDLWLAFHETDGLGCPKMSILQYKRRKHNT